MDWFLYDNGLRHERVNDNPVSLNKSTCDSQNHMGLDINPMGKSLNIQKLLTMSEITVKNPTLIDQIMALK